MNFIFSLSFFPPFFFLAQSRLTLKSSFLFRGCAYWFLIFYFCFYCYVVLYYFFPSHFRNKKRCGNKTTRVRDSNNLSVVSSWELLCGCGGIPVLFYLMLFDYWDIKTLSAPLLDSPELESNRGITSSAVIMSCNSIFEGSSAKEWKVFGESMKTSGCRA